MSQSTDEHTPPHWFKARASNWFWSLTPTCREIARLTSAQREHPLSIGMRLRLGLHRGFCQWCARYAEQLDFIHDASLILSDHTDEIGGPSLGHDAKARMKRALQREPGED